MDLQGHKHDVSKSRPCSVKGASGVKLLCLAKIWILAIALNNYMSGFCESIIQSHNIIIKQLNH